MITRTGTIELTLAHSPDADDAFMWWPLGTPDRAPAVDTGRFRFRTIAADISDLNRRAEERGDLDITAISMHAYAHVADRYVLTTCGASMGEGYGPRVVARHDDTRVGTDWLADPEVTIAVPGRRTSAFLALRLMLGRDFRFLEMPFDRITRAVAAGDAHAGVVIHDAQLTFADHGLRLVADLGAWWAGETGLPLPLGGNAVRRDLDDRFGPGAVREVARVLRASIAHALEHRSEGLAVAAAYAPDAPADLVDRFVEMYVNGLTIEAGERGERAVREFLRRGEKVGLIPAGAAGKAGMVG